MSDDFRVNIGGREYVGQKPERVSDSSQSTGSAELLRKLMNASAPYLRRKKMTPRHQCKALNDVWAKCAEHLKKQNDKVSLNERSERQVPLFG